MSKDFPGRPDHPDFWLLSQALTDLDAQSDAGQDFVQVAGRLIDPASAVYVAQQRAQRAMMQSSPGVSGVRAAFSVVGAAWLDGLLTGMAVQRARTQEGAQTWTEEDTRRILPGNAEACTVCGGTVFARVQPGRYACSGCGAHQVRQEGQ